MAKNTSKEVNDGFFKGYDIKWLREEPSHPDFFLVAEYDALGEPEEASKEEAEPEKPKKKSKKLIK